MSQRRIAVIGDCHGCIDELKQLHALLRAEGVDEVWHAGDLVDRGPDSGAVVQYCRLNNIKGVMGNHDSVIVNWYERGETPRNPDKKRTLEQIKSKEDWEYLKALPLLHVFDDLNLVIVHAGLRNKPLYAQDKQVCHLQMVHPTLPGTKWFNKTMKGEVESELVKQGWARWYDVYNYPYDVIYGHSVVRSPLVIQNPGGGRTIGIDTGSVFGGYLTAAIMPDMKFISVKCKHYTGELRFDSQTGEIFNSNVDNE